MSEESLHQILGDIERSVRDFTGAEAALAKAEQRRDHTRQAVLEQVERMHAEVDTVHAPELIGVLRHLYWQQPGIHGRPLAEAAGLHLNDMLAAIGPAPSGIRCAHRGTEQLRTSRPVLEAAASSWRTKRSRIVSQAQVSARVRERFQR
ncbi:hypothetical protein ACFV7Q_38585 [Streptomyces sp. NPDC059851]|uniref:hypothetical protein n=1 Tax=Streptomyces sp. NPDC059851 TaxID=3346971 RepID=UPI00365AF520